MTGERTHARRLTAVLACAFAITLLQSACGSKPARSSDPAQWHVEADNAFGRGQTLWREADEATATGTSDAAVGLRAEACASWETAGRYYRNVFRLTEPIPARRNPRAQMAFCAARAFSKAACAFPAAKKSDHLAIMALFWLDQAERLAPKHRQVLYERAYLCDSQVAGARDLERARMNYERYVAATDEAEQLVRGEAERVARARERVEALKAPAGG